MNLFSQKKITFIIGLFGFLFVFLNPIYAGAGRIEIENLNEVGYSGQSGMYIQARIYNDSHANTVAGEKAEFQVKNPRPGDRCITTNTTANEYGQIFGQCFAEQPGTITIYVHSLDQGDDSSEYLLTFVTPKPTTIQNKIIMQPTTNSLPTPSVIPPTTFTPLSLSPTPTSSLLIQGLTNKKSQVLLLIVILVLGLLSVLYVGKYNNRNWYRLLAEAKRKLLKRLIK